MNDHDNAILDDSIAEGVHLVRGTPLHCLLCDSPATKVTTADHYTAHPLNGGFKGICVMVTCTSCEGMFELHLENQPEGVVIVPVGY